MKKITIKGSVEKLSPAAPMIVAAVAAAVLLPIRIWQLFANTDLATGFFVEKNAIVYIFYIVAVLACLAIVVLSYLSGKMPGSKPAEVKAVFSGIASLLLAFGFGYTVLPLLSDLQNEAINTGLGMFEAAKLSGNLRNMLEMVFSAVAMIAFVLYAVSCFTGKRAWLKYTAVLFLAAPMWGVFRILSYFSYTISYLVSAELFCELYAALFLMLFLFSYSRFITRTGSEGNTWAVVSTGLISTLFCVLASVPRIFTSIVGLGTVEGFGIDWLYVTGAVFSLTAVLSCVFRGVQDKTPEERIPESAGEDGDIPVQPFTVE